MPITQDRMMSLIAAARDFQQGLESAERVIKTQCENAEQGIITWKEAAHNIRIFCVRQALLVHEGESVGTVLVEFRHFKSNYARNKSSAKWQKQNRPRKTAQRREQDFGETDHKIYKDKPEVNRSTAPDSLARSDKLTGAPIEPLVEPEEDFQKRLDPSIAEDEDDKLDIQTNLEPSAKSKVDREIEEALKQEQGKEQ